MHIDLILKTIGKYENKPTSVHIFLKAFFSSTKGSYKPLRRILNEDIRETSKEAEGRKARNFCRLVKYLADQKLIEKKYVAKKWLITLTPKGRKKLETRQQEFRHPDSYNSEKTKNTIIVVFDIPEQERQKRDWLRSCLTHLEFKKIQQSVWMGHRKIPQTLLEDLAKLNMLKYVEIFTAQKLGSLLA